MLTDIFHVLNEKALFAFHISHVNVLSALGTSRWKHEGLRCTFKNYSLVLFLLRLMDIFRPPQFFYGSHHADIQFAVKNSGYLPFLSCA